MKIADELSTININALKDTIKNRPPELTTLVRCLEALLELQEDLFGCWITNAKVLNERQFPYLIYYFSGKIRYLVNGLVTQISQGNEFSVSILLRSLMENSSNALFVSKGTDNAATAHDLLLAASCKRQIYNLLQIANPNIKVNLDQIDKASIEKVKRKRENFLPFQFQMRTLWYAAKRLGIIDDIGTMPEINDLIALLLLRDGIVKRIQKKPFGSIENIVKQAQKKVRDQAFAEALNYDHHYRISSGDVHTNYQNDKYIFASIDSAICTSNYEMLDWYIVLACEYLYISCDSAIGVIQDIKEQSRLYNRLDELVIDIGMTIATIWRRIVEVPKSTKTRI